MTVIKDDLLLFNKFFAEYQHSFIRFARTYIRDDVAAEDIVVEAMMYYWENRQRLPGDTNLPAYVLTIIKHKCLNHLRHLQAKEEALNDLTAHSQWELTTRITTLEACEPNELFDTEIRTIIDKVLLKLPDKTRRAFLLSRYENKSHREIAAILNISTKGVEFHITKVTNILRLALKDYLFLFILVFYLLVNR
ncbi:RNA polymerase sigma-70 factor [uncultured Bacteroides sp.]|uniref:RNA polymerase sigma-70 factor n=1 Tax=uncultured Bacteroides sp. TaxID=162156 RepID=UPI002AA7DC59|nr:RNA polymerase sigma-70 factor [uncultured Bacteroides sp.]